MIRPSGMVVYACLRHVVTLIRNSKVTSVERLRERLIREGWSGEVVDAAIDVWRRLS